MSRLFLRRLKSTQGSHSNRKVREPLGEGSFVLISENRRQDEHRDLSIRLDGLERRANRDLRLPVSDVADEQAVHRTRLLHVLLDVDRRLPLIGRVLEQE